MNSYRKWLAETFRYLVCGISTVLVNLVSYHLLSTYVWGTLASNTAAFFLSVLYAYITNSVFVFRVKCTWQSFRDFFGMRIGTILIDNGGLMLLIRLGCHDLVAKCIVNVVIIALNYIFSKLFIFKKRV
ncbi:GtrA family protein [uncultured Flavonifractor sp.]|uniref:GtrA family protein n=1 Tax=uncultured Flavonifractor sp. TaxID=1193534 RepID=UPI002612CCEE|nr:GtrA family protein [uncultured Flavonifractor sp.]